MQKNLYLGVLLAPYRVDYYNYLHDKLNFEIYFQLKGFNGQLFDNSKLIVQSTYMPRYIKGVGKEQRRVCFGIKRLIKMYRPRIVFVPEFSILTWWVIILRVIFNYNFKIISQCDDSYNMIVNGGFSKLHTLSRNFCLKHIDEIVLADEKAMEWYQENYKKGIFTPIIRNEEINNYNTAIIDSFINKYKGIYKTNPNIILLFVARMIEVKNFPVLIEACKHLDLDYTLLVVGDGLMRSRWENMAKSDGINAYFLGQKNGEELEAIYKLSDIFILPSYLEPFGAVTNEALLNGCYCCISEKAGSSCLIRNGVNGYTFNPYDAKDLADKITLASKKVKSDCYTSKMSCSFNEYMHPLCEYINMCQM